MNDKNSKANKNWSDYAYEPYDLPKKNDWTRPVCMHPQHGFPTMLYIPPGQTHTHTCPGCGQQTTCVGRMIHCG